MGTTKIVCGMCGTSATVKNEDLEVMREHRCSNPECNRRMTDMELVGLKAVYFLRLATIYRNTFGNRKSRFDFEINIKPQYVPDWAVGAALTEEAVHDTDN